MTARELREIRPNSYVAMRQLHAACCVCPVEAVEQECGGEFGVVELSVYESEYEEP
jgi:hypothetical protein